MKNSIAQHQQHLQNMLVSLKDEWQHFLRADRQVRATQLRVNLLREQITKAIQEKRDGFDDERFLKNRIESVDYQISKIMRGDSDGAWIVPG